METRLKARQAQEIRRMFVAATHEEEPVNDESSDSELDNEEELEGSENDGLEEQNSSSDEEIVAQEVEGTKRCRILQPVSSKREKIFLYGKNGFKWSLCPPAPRSRSSTPISPINSPCGVGPAASVTTEGGAWSLLIPDATLEEIVTHTNMNIEKKKCNFSTQATFIHKMDNYELRAFIGLIYFSGLQGSTRRNIQTLYDKLSSPIFRATMPRARFEFLLSVLRFDDKSTRQQRKKTDKLAPIRSVWNTFISNSKSHFTPRQNVTIDEQLLSFVSRCSFRVYIKNKPDKYGLKLVTMNDSETSYLFDALPYIGRVAVEASESVPSYYVKKLSKSIRGSGRNITCDNWFTSIPLVEKLKMEDSLTLVGTIRKDEREIPEAMKEISEIHSSKFVYANNMTLVSYKPNKKKTVILISSLHQLGKVPPNHNKPEIILYYNQTKGATDTFDQMCHEYSVARGTRRWPLRFFYGILDQSSINAFILFSLNKDNKLITRCQFNENLAYHLVHPFLLRRLSLPTLRLSVRSLIELVLGIDFSTHQLPDATDYTLDKQVRCAFCPRGKDKKTRYICSKCRLPRCQDHRSMQCIQCAPDN